VPQCRSNRKAIGYCHGRADLHVLPVPGALKKPSFNRALDRLPAHPFYQE
jgi:hypothetical protein